MTPVTRAPFSAPVGRPQSDGAGRRAFAEASLGIRSFKTHSLLSASEVASATKASVPELKGRPTVIDHCFSSVAATPPELYGAARVRGLRGPQPSAAGRAS